MKKMIRVLACALALLIALCGVGMAEEKNTAGLLATVNGADVEIKDALAEYEYYAELYTMYGMENQLEALKQDIANYYVKVALILNQFDVLGLEADMEALKAEAKAEYDAAVKSYATYVQKDGLTEAQIAEAAEELLISDGYDLAYFEKYFYDNLRMNSVFEYYTKDIAIDEEEVQDYYKARVDSERDLYAGSFAYYEQAGSSGERIMYTPEGIRLVKHILVLLGSEEQQKIAGLEAQLADAEAALAAEGADKEKLTAEKAAIEAQIDEVFATIEPKAQEIMDKLTAGEDFLALLAEYGEDPGMESEPYATEGYQVHAESTQWVIPFRDGAMALEKPGDVSQPVRTSYGLHIIRYEGDVAPGAVPYEDVKDALKNELLNDEINSLYNGLVEQWFAEAEIVFYLENFDPAQETVTAE